VIEICINHITLSKNRQVKVLLIEHPSDQATHIVRFFGGQLLTLQIVMSAVHFHLDQSIDFELKRWIMKRTALPVGAALTPAIRKAARIR